MKGKSMFVASGVAVAMLAHPGAEAASGREGLEACVQALTRTLSESQGAGVNARISEDSTAHDRRLESPTLFSLDARDSRDGEIVYKADCVVNSRGEVQRLVKLPLDAPSAEIRVNL
jgi:hypothetical protein